MKNLLDKKLFKNTIDQGIFPIFFQFSTLLLLIFILIYTLPYHNIQGVPESDPLIYTNLGNLLFWIYWMMGIILFVLVWGRLWCAICPLGLINGLFSKIGFKLNYPKKLRNWYGLAITFIVLQILLNIFKINHFPDFTARLIIVFILCAIFFGIFFQDRIFCRYLCPIGSMLGVYSCFSPMELRIKDKKTCAQCTNKECIKGKIDSYNLYLGNKKISIKTNSVPCPAQIYPGALEESTHCFLCGKCIKNCPNNNIRWNFRNFFKEIFNPSDRSFSETLFLILIMGMIIDKLVPLWPGLEQKIFLNMDLNLSILNLQTIIFYLWIYLFLPGLIILLPGILIYFISQIRIKKVESEKDSNITFEPIKLDKIIGYSTNIFIPLVFFSHTSLALVKILTRGGYVFYGFMDPIGIKTYRAIYLAEILNPPSNIIPITVIRWLLIFLILTGALISIVSIFKINRTDQFKRNKFAFAAINLIVVSFISIILLLIIKSWLFI
ncbi:4Fe-4S binding protein [Candidatus Poribacteria bacterium]|nr:4Fe-4S binding protein [Candidatus Poribacteria bacterium]